MYVERDVLKEDRDFVFSLRAGSTDWCYALCDVFPSAEVKQAAFKRGRSECGSFLRRCRQRLHVVNRPFGPREGVGVRPSGSFIQFSGDRKYE